MITDHFKSRGYHILAQRLDGPSFWTSIDGTAQFLYKDYMISMSTAGRSKGACMQPVCIFLPGDDYNNVAQDGFHTVQDAIQWIDQQVDLDSVYNTISDPLRRTASTYAQALRKYIDDTKMDANKFNSLVDHYLTQYPKTDVRLLLSSLADADMELDGFQLAMNVLHI